MTLTHVNNIEVFDVSAVAFALKGATIKYEFRGTSPWLNLYVDESEDPHFVAAVVEWAIGLPSSTHLSSIPCLVQNWILTEGPSIPLKPSSTPTI